MFDYPKLIKWIARRKGTTPVIAREELGDYFRLLRCKYTKEQIEKSFKLAYKDISCTSVERFKSFVTSDLKRKYT